MTINAHPVLPEFEYIRPISLAEASQFLIDHPREARPLAGGTDIFVRLRDGAWQVKYLVDIKHLDGTRPLTFDLINGLRIGAGVNMNQVIASPLIREHYPLLAEACQTVASFQLRTRATVVGNLCNASPAGDTIGACLVMNGRLEVHGIHGCRYIDLASFFLGPGSTVLQAGDVVTCLQLPIPPVGTAGTYLKLGRNTWSDLSIVGITAYAYPDPALISGYRFRVALASVAPVPLLVTSIEDYLAAHPITSAAFQEAAHLAESTCDPIDDVRGSAIYRREMVSNLTKKALHNVWLKLQSTGGSL